MIYQVRDKVGIRLYRIKVHSFAQAVAFVATVYGLSLEDSYSRLTLVANDPSPHVFYDYAVNSFDCEE